MNKSDASSGSATRRQQLTGWLARHDVPQSGIVMIMALLGGVSTGLAAVLFRRLILGVQTIAFQSPHAFWAAITPFHLILIPAFGGLIVGLLVTFGAPEARGAGIPEVMEAVAMRGGRIHPRVALIKPLAAAICIGTGGSVGREGPIVQIGSSLGSLISQFFHLNDEQTRTLVACGAAGGIAATFNAPIAGSIFALEVILGQFHVMYFGAVVVSAVTADVIAQIFEGNVRAFSVPAYNALQTPWELSFYALLGIAAGLLAVLFTYLLSRAEDGWLRVPLPIYARPALGGALLGVLGIISWKVEGMPRIFGVGYGTIDDALFGQLGIGIALSLLLLKSLATSLTLASGGSGGVFAPSLFMGAMLGEAYGRFLHQLLPAQTAPSGAYALVGMAAFVSGTTHTPVTAILILFEMTGDYKLILPLMLATVLSTIVARTLYPESIYTEKLRRRGVHWEQAQHIDVMRGVTVAEAMTTHLDTVPHDMPLATLTEEFERTHHHGFPVLDDNGRLAGIVSLSDLDRALATGPVTGKTVADIATSSGLIVAYPDEPMWVALRRLGQHNISRLPVLKRAGSRQIVGLVRRSDIVQAYDKALVKRAKAQHKNELMRLGKLDGVRLVHFEITDRSPVAGRQVKEIDLPEGCLLVSVRRGHKLHVAHGHTTLQEGDTIAIMAEEGQLAQIERELLPQFTKGPPIRPRRVRHYEFTIPAGATCSGRPVRELHLPEGCILVSVTRNEEAIVPHGDTVLAAGDIVELFGIVDDIETAVARLSQCGFQG